MFAWLLSSQDLAGDLVGAEAAFGADEPCSQQGLMCKKVDLVSGLVVLSRKYCVSNKEPRMLSFCTGPQKLCS